MARKGPSKPRETVTERRQKRRRRPRTSRLLPLLGLGALGLTTYWVARRRGPEEGRRPAAPAEPEAPPGELPDDAEVSWIAGPSGTLRVAERHPAGRLPVVFVHGLGGRLEHWSAQIAALGPGLRILALDLPGHGESDAAPGGDSSVPALASAIGAVAASFGLRRFVLVAHSLGALAAIDYAGACPERVAGLLLVDPSGDQTRARPGDRERFLAALRRDPRGECEGNFRHFLTAARPAVARRVLEDLAATSERTLLTALESSAAYSPVAALERYPGPVLGLVSELNDSSMSLHRLNEDLRARRLLGVSHWLMMDRPEAVLEALWHLLEEVDS